MKQAREQYADNNLYKKIIVSFCFLFLLFFNSTSNAQQPTADPSKIMNALESAFISIEDLNNEYSWLATYGQSTEWETVQVNWKTNNGLHIEDSDNFIFANIVFVGEYGEVITISASYLKYIDEPDRFLQAGYQRSYLLPTEYAYERSNYEPGAGRYVHKIIFFKNEWTFAVVDVMLLAAEPAQAEAERLAKLFWSRLPDNLPPPVPQGDGNITSTVTDPGGGDTGTVVTPPDGAVPGWGDNTNIIPPNLPPHSLADDIPDGALPAATGLAALITLLGTLPIVWFSGTTPLELLNELKALLNANQYQASQPPNIVMPKDGDVNEHGEVWSTLSGGFVGRRVYEEDQVSLKK